MLIRWNGKNVWSIGTGLMDASVVQIIPGPNELKKEHWEAIKKHPVVLERMKEEVIDMKRGKVMLLEIIEVKKAAPKNDNDENDNDDQDQAAILSLGAKEAKALIAETFNIELLREWKEAATRKGDLEAIEKQIAEIEKDREDDSSDE